MEPIATRTLQPLPPTAEVELLAAVLAAERFAVVLQDESPPPPDQGAEVRAIVRANRRLRDGAWRN